jgi:hypothetical protein
MIRLNDTCAGKVETKFLDFEPRNSGKDSSSNFLFIHYWYTHTILKLLLQARIITCRMRVNRIPRWLDGNRENYAGAEVKQLVGDINVIDLWNLILCLWVWACRSEGSVIFTLRFIYPCTKREMLWLKWPSWFIAKKICLLIYNNLFQSPEVLCRVCDYTQIFYVTSHLVTAW